MKRIALLFWSATYGPEQRFHFTAQLGIGLREYDFAAFYRALKQLSLSR
jgi:hypothetical protein